MFLVLRLVDFNLMVSFRVSSRHCFHNDGIRVLIVLGSQIVFIPLFRRGFRTGPPENG